VQGLTEGGDELTPAMLRSPFLDEYVPDHPRSGSSPSMIDRR